MRELEEPPCIGLSDKHNWNSNPHGYRFKETVVKIYLCTNCGLISVVRTNYFKTTE